MNTETKTNHKLYDEAFKKSAVEHWLISGKSARQVVTELGTNVQNLTKWKPCRRRTVACKKSCTGWRSSGTFKKTLGHNLRTIRHRFERIKTMATEYPIAALCVTLNVTRSGYHAWAGREPGARAQANAKLLPLITQAHRESRQTYGRPRILNWLQQRGQRCGRTRIARLMRVAGLSSRPQRGFRPVSLTDSKHDLPVAPNRLRDLAIPRQRDAIWVADITDVETGEGWLYVAGVLDRGTRRCVGWAMGDTLATTLQLAALDKALKQRRPSAGLVHHFDRGVQYASAAYWQRLAQAGFPQYEPSRQLL